MDDGLICGAPVDRAVDAGLTAGCSILVRGTIQINLNHIGPIQLVQHRARAGDGYLLPLKPADISERELVRPDATIFLPNFAISCQAKDMTASRLFPQMERDVFDSTSPNFPSRSTATS